MSLLTLGIQALGLLGDFPLYVRPYFVPRRYLLGRHLIPAVIAPIVVEAVLFIACFVWDFSGIPKQPIFPLHLFKKFREYTILLAYSLL
jgi:hypothetical protein